MLFIKSFVWLLLVHTATSEEGERILDISFSLDSIYNHFSYGENGHTCLNVETTGPMNASIGGCGRLMYIGTFPQGPPIPLNRKIIQTALGYGTPDKCNSSDLSVLIIAKFAREYMFNISRCRCPKVTAPLKTPELQYMSTSVCQPEIDNNKDKYQQFQRFLKKDEPIQDELEMPQALEQAVFDPLKTMCVRYRGDSLLHLKIRRCEMTENITIVAGSDYIYGITEKDVLKRMFNYECMKKGPNWWIEILPTSPLEGRVSLELFACSIDEFAPNEKELDRAFPVWIPDTDWQKHEQKFYFSYSPWSRNSYPADLKSMIDTATIGGKSRIRMELNTTFPVSIYVSRSRYEFTKGIALVEDSMSRVVYLDKALLLKMRSMSMGQKFSKNDADDALYIHILLQETRTQGYVGFRMVSGNGKKKSMKQEVSTAFAMPANSTFVRKVKIVELVNEGVLNWRQVGFEIQSSEYVELFVSKCRRSEKVILAGHVKSGDRKPSHHVLTKIMELFEETCDELDCVEDDEAFLHIVSSYGEAVGNIKFARFNASSQRNDTPPIPFIPLTPEFTASSDDQFIQYDSHQGDHVEIDLRYFLKTVMSYPFMDLIMELDSKKPVNLVFSKCNGLVARNVSIAVNNGYIVRLEEVEALHDLMMTPSCHNTAEYGLFLHTHNTGYKGMINIYMENFRATIPHNGGQFNAKNNSNHVVKIPLGNMEHSLSIRLTNYQLYPLQVTLAMCSLSQESFEFPMMHVTFADIVLDVDQLSELREASKNCTAPLKDILLVTIKSENAIGRLTIDRMNAEDCEHGNCEKGGIQFFRNTTGLSIAH